MPEIPEPPPWTALPAQETIDRIIVYDAATVTDEEGSATILYDSDEHPEGLAGVLGDMKPGDKVRAFVTGRSTGDGDG